MQNTLIKKSEPFKILSIDGGGIRGVLPAQILTQMESYLKQSREKKSLWENFDLITGTSTGGIIALSLALGIPASEILEIYLDKAKTIFGNKRNLFGRIFYSGHERNDLETIIRSLFSDYNKGKDPLIGNCKTHVAIPVYDLNTGKPKVIKSKYHSSFNRDYQIPAYMVALATSAAPTFFDPYSCNYKNQQGHDINLHHLIDGGVFANNPSLGCLLEVQQSFDLELKNIKMLSLGTGHYKFSDSISRENYGLGYWVKKERLTEVFLQAQAQEVENLISIMKNGIGKQEKDRFTYIRLDAELDEMSRVKLDETRKKKLNEISILGKSLWDRNSEDIIKNFLS